MRSLGAFVGRQISRTNLFAGRSMLRIDTVAPGRDVARIEQFLNRYFVEIRIAEVFAAIGIEAPLHFRDVMDSSRGACARFLISRAIQHRQHLQDADTARARRRRGDYLVLSMVAPQRLALTSLTS